MLPTLRKHAGIIRDYTITRFEQAGPSFRLRAQVTFVDDSRLYIRETVLEGLERIYAYHWQAPDGSLRIRWDNAPHWDVETFPHHKHVESQQKVCLSYERTLEQVFAIIADRMAVG